MKNYFKRYSRVVLLIAILLLSLNLIPVYAYEYSEGVYFPAYMGGKNRNAHFIASTGMLFTSVEAPTLSYLLLETGDKILDEAGNFLLDESSPPLGELLLSFSSLLGWDTVLQTEGSPLMSTTALSLLSSSMIREGNEEFIAILNMEPVSSLQREGALGLAASSVIEPVISLQREGSVGLLASLNMESISSLTAPPGDMYLLLETGDRMLDEIGNSLLNELSVPADGINLNISSLLAWNASLQREGGIALSIASSIASVNSLDRQGSETLSGVSAITPINSLDRQGTTTLQASVNMESVSSLSRAVLLETGDAILFENNDSIIKEN